MTTLSEKKNKEEERLVRQLGEGSQSAFTRLFDLYADRLYGYARKLTKSPALAEDVVQETFMRIWENKGNIRSDTSFQSYLFQISYHLVIDAFRSQIETIDIEDYIHFPGSELATENEAETILAAEDYRLYLSQSLSRLTARQQEIFRLSYEQKLSPKEISELTSLSEKTVRNQLSIIFATLKRDLLLYLLFLSCF